MMGLTFTLGLTLGFEWVDENFEGGGWILHLLFFKIIYFKGMGDEQ